MRSLLLPLLVIAALAGPVAAAETRDPWTWPFARSSIWNTPRGATAVLVPANLPATVDGGTAYIGIDVERHVTVPDGAPVRPVYPPSSWGQRWPGDTAFAYRNGAQWSMPLPDAFRQADAAPPHTPNACISFLLPGGRELRQLEPTCRLWDDAVTDRRIIGWPAAPVDLYGGGIGGAHWGSGLSVLGGSLRVGELSAAGPIRHALKLNIWGRHLYYNSTTKGWRWPADRADAYAASNYQGSNPALRMGALLALPVDATAASLQITSTPGRKLLAVLRDYGCYISDDSGWNAYDLCAEDGVAAEVVTLGCTLGGTGGTLNNEIRRLIGALCVVDDNRADAIGGAGARLAAWAPRLVDLAWGGPTNLTAAVVGGAVHLAWTAPAGWSAAAYEVERQVAGGAWTALAEVAATTCDDTAPPRGAALAWRVRGVHAATGNAGAWAVCTLAALPARRLDLGVWRGGVPQAIAGEILPGPLPLLPYGDGLYRDGLDPAITWAMILLPAGTG